MKITIQKLSNKGYGLGDLPGIQVPFSWPGEILEVKLVGPQQAKINKIIKASPARTQISCLHFGHCWGCPWLMIDYSTQLEAKMQKIKYALNRVNLSLSISRIVASPKTQAFRSRAQFKTDGRELGYVSPQDGTIVPIKQCLALNHHCQKLLNQLQQKLPCKSWIPPNPHKWRFIEIDDTITDINQIVLDRRLPFQQGNHEQNNALKKWVATKAKLLPTESKILELYSGSGNLTRALPAKHFSEIHCVELKSPQTNNPHKKIISHQLNLYKKKSLQKLRHKIGSIDSVLADPPRTGLQCKKELINLFPEIKNIMLISCSIENFAHDIAYLIKKGFHVSEVCPFDFFPNTPHIEIATILKRSL